MASIHPFRARLLPFYLALALTGCTVSITREPENLTTLKNEVSEYVDSGAYAKGLATAAAPAKDWITRRAKHSNDKLAVVFDIDETVLSNLEHIRKMDWGYQPDIWDRWVQQANAPAINPLKEVYQTAIDHQVTVFFITGRKERLREATARNLRAQGMGKYEALIVRPNPSTSPAAVFKSAERERISRLGYTIIANFGDQQTDLDGGHAERTFKLPNPFYLIP
jgi:acid phosphatase